MLEELKHTSNLTQTENGALAYRTTRSACLDFFAVCGALRHESDRLIIRKFMRAYAEDPVTAMRILFYARDIRGGLGERRLFQVIIRHLAQTHPGSVIRNLLLFGEYGRFDDILSLLGTRCETALEKYIRHRLQQDVRLMQKNKPVSLLAKWLPSVNTSASHTREQARQICRLLGMREKEYRKTLSALRTHIGIVENQLRQQDYTFSYEKLPSRALLKYRRAFHIHDKKRYRMYLKHVSEGKAHMNTGTLYPYDIIRGVMKMSSEDSLEALNTAWNALPDYTDNRNALAVIDGSGSMFWGYEGSIAPITVAVSLGIYFAERNRGHFANHFITFSRTPQLVEIHGDNIAQKAEYCMSYNEIINTDLGAVFNLLLQTAIEYQLPQEEMPELLYIISDMEFDEGVDTDSTVHEGAKAQFESYGYRLPQVVYWNVSARREQLPVQMNEDGVALVSGASPSLFSQMLSQDLTPFSLMEQIISSERYKAVCA